jgi:hypothetical protein
MSFNGEITLGHILIVVSTLVSVSGAFFSLRGRMDVFATLIDAHNRRVDRMEQVNETRLLRLENNDIRLTDIVQELLGQNRERIRWDGMDRRSFTDRRDKTE